MYSKTLRLMSSRCVLTLSESVVSHIYCFKRPPEAMSICDTSETTESNIVPWRFLSVHLRLARFAVSESDLFVVCSWLAVLFCWLRLTARLLLGF